MFFSIVISVKRSPTIYFIRSVPFFLASLINSNVIQLSYGSSQTLTAPGSGLGKDPGLVQQRKSHLNWTVSQIWTKVLLLPKTNKQKKNRTLEIVALRVISEPIADRCHRCVTGRQNFREFAELK